MNALDSAPWTLDSYQWILSVGVPPMARPPPVTVDLTTGTPPADGIEDITPRIRSQDAATFPEMDSDADMGMAAPTTPPHLRRACHQQPPAAPGHETCPICLMPIHPAADGPTSTFRWPHCHHAFHTGCAAHMVVEQPRPPAPHAGSPGTMLPT